MTIAQSLAVMGFGALLTLFGLVFLLNLFGVADEMAAQHYRERTRMSQVPPWKWFSPEDTEDKDTELRRFKRWQRPFAVPWALGGVAVFVVGAVSLIRAF